MGLFAAQAAVLPADPARQIPSGADWLAVGLTPLQGFERRYPRARNLRGQVLRDVVREGIAAPCARAAWDAWYREHYGPPVEVPPVAVVSSGKDLA